MLVHLLGLFRLAASNAVKVDFRVDLNNFSADEQAAARVLEKIRQNPWLFLPPLKTPTQELFGLVGRRGLFLLTLIRLVFVDDAKEEAQQAPGVLQVWVQEGIEGEVVEVAKGFEVLDALETDLVAVGGFLKILLAHVAEVDEVFLFSEHAGHLFEALDDGLDERHGFEVFKRLHLGAGNLFGLLD